MIIYLGLLLQLLYIQMIIHLGLLIPVLTVQSLWWMQVSPGGGRRQRGNEFTLWSVVLKSSLI